MAEGALFVDKVLTDTTHAVSMSVRKSALQGLQWVQTAGAGTATVAVYASVLAFSDPRLDDLDGAGNPYWGLTPMVFTATPAGTVDSGLLPMAESGVATLLVEFVVTGTITLSLFTFLNPAQT